MQVGLYAFRREGIVKVSVIVGRYSFCVHLVFVRGGGVPSPQRNGDPTAVPTASAISMFNSVGRHQCMSIERPKVGRRWIDYKTARST
jgi:hypothetical protein